MIPTGVPSKYGTPFLSANHKNYLIIKDYFSDMWYYEENVK